MNAEDVISKLVEGNKRYISGKLSEKDIIKKREGSKTGQKPMATVVCCSDSRVVPEFIFDTNLEEIFTIITAGNVVGGIALGSIEYAVGHLHTPLLIVMGHEKCGAVTAAYDDHKEASITKIVDKIKPAVERTKKGGEKNAEIEEAIKENVKNVIEEIKKSPIVEKALKEGKLKILGMKYYFEDGRVETIN
ncbi:carbonic anhydrase [Candidatus Micrarchaeota archaeon]|nr:carbonic anhydrase [Candidatus Micrarchaeota archaeon]